MLRSHTSSVERGKAHKGSALLPVLLIVDVLLVVSCGGSSSGGGTTSKGATTGASTTTAETSSADHMSGMAQGTTGMQGMAMGMEMVDPATAGLTVDFNSDPASPQPNQPTTLRYLFTDTKSGNTVTAFSLEHEKQMHLVAVSQDLSQFQHIHPEVEADGAWTVTTTFPEDANYVLFDEFSYNDQDVLDRRELTVGQASNTSASLSPDTSPKTEQGLTVSLSAPETITAGEDASFTAHVTHDGQPVTDLEPYLGAPAHVVIISADTRDFTHTHGMVSGMASMDSTPPSSFGPDITFDNTFPHAGLYKIWVQFTYQGNVVTVPYVVEVH
jgi:hypothetical protein